MNQKKYSLLYPDINARYRTLSDVTMHDLGMDQLCKKLSAKEREQNYIQNVMARMYADPAVTQYRCGNQLCIRDAGSDDAAVPAVQDIWKSQGTGWLCHRYGGKSSGIQQVGAGF